MKFRKLAAAIPVALALAWSAPASAHCDTLDGPVVSAARKALETGNVNLVLVWVQKNDEAELRNAFQRTRNVRKAGGEAKELADLYFFETLVRVHRAGEGAAYTGLKPTGTIEPPVAAADRAIENGKLEALAKLIFERIETGLHRQFDEVMAKKSTTRTTSRQAGPMRARTSSSCTTPSGSMRRPKQWRRSMWRKPPGPRLTPIESTEIRDSEAAPDGAPGIACQARASTNEPGVRPDRRARRAQLGRSGRHALGR